MRCLLLVASFAELNAIVAGSFSAQLLPDLSYHLESSAGSIATFKIGENNLELWEKYSPEKFPVMTWKSMPRDNHGKDTGSVYVFPRTSDGLVKIGYRGIKVSYSSKSYSLMLTASTVHKFPASSRGGPLQSEWPMVSASSTSG